jgi:endonuclease-3
MRSIIRQYNFEKVFVCFRKHYITVPLETFGTNPYKTLVSTILSSRTKDETTLQASKRLFKKAPNINKLGKLSQQEIRKLIYPVGFYKTKAKHLKSRTNILNNKFNGKIPKMKKELVKLPGVGRKTANLVLNRAFAIPAIAVDTHVHKISNLLGWVDTNTPEKTEKKLVKILPKKYWSEINRLFVSIGRQHTTKKNLENFLKNNSLLQLTK